MPDGVHAHGAGKWPDGTRDAEPLPRYSTGLMIQIDGLTKVYGRHGTAVTALHDVSLALEPGVHGVVGPNGAGKTTLLGLVLGFLHPTEGRVAIDGSSPRRYLRNSGAAYLPERFRLPAQWPVGAALLALARLDGHAASSARDRVAVQIRRLGLDDHADRPVGALSRGLLQRVGLAQALLTDRRLVVLDEPTEGLDPLWRIRFRELVDSLRDGDRTVLLASHDLNEVERLADDVVILDDGRLGEIVDVRQQPGEPLRYRLSVDAADDALRIAFPSAERRDEGTVVVEVADTDELSHRLAALLDAGARLRAVVPMGGDLEARVRQRLEDA